MKPQYAVYRGGIKPIYTIEGDITRHSYSIRKDGTEVLRLRKKIAKLLTEYTIEKELGIEIIGETKMKISTEDDEEPWDIIEDEVDEKIEQEIDDNVEEKFI